MCVIIVHRPQGTWHYSDRISKSNDPNLDTTKFQQHKLDKTNAQWTQDWMDRSLLLCLCNVFPVPVNSSFTDLTREREQTNNNKTPTPTHTHTLSHTHTHTHTHTRLWMKSKKTNSYWTCEHCSSLQNQSYATPLSQTKLQAFWKGQAYPPANPVLIRQLVLVYQYW